jgi:uncharacterized lipoprotein YmbA
MKPTRMNMQKSWACRARRALGAAVVVTAAGCASNPSAVLLMLPPAVTAPSAVTAPAAPNGAASRVLSVSRVEVPEYLTTRRVRYRADASAVAEWPDTYWGERIEVGVSREFMAALHEQLPAWRVCEAACSEQSPAASLQVQLNRVDYMRGERRLRANVRIAVWSAERPARLLRSEERAYDIAGDDDTARSQARATTELLRRVASDAAASVTAAPLP